MPSSMSHTYFGIDIYNNLNIKTKNRINKEYFKTFCQGPDIFYFYNLFIGKKSKEIYKLGLNIHTHNTKDFFIHTIKYIMNNNLKENKQIMSFLYGYICHYYLDTICHPFIYYKTGKLIKKRKNTYKYNTKHADMEFFIDRYMINKREQISPNKYKIHTQFLNVNTFDKDLHNLINNIFKIYKFKYNDISNIYLKAIKDMKLFFRLFCYDRFKIKYYIYLTIDHLTGKNITKTNEFSYGGDYKKRINYLNLNNKKWIHPCDKSITSNNSFIDLYNDAINKCTKNIEIINNIINNNKLDIQKLNNIFDNTSYLTGLDCNDKRELKYFEY